jgi:hypothetical protein
MKASTSKDLKLDEVGDLTPTDEEKQSGGIDRQLQLHWRAGDGLVRAPSKI